MDQYAIVCLKKAFKNSRENRAKGLKSYEAIFEIRNKRTSIDYLADPDFNGYMVALQKRIKDNWLPPKASISIRITTDFKIENDGTITDIKILNPGNKDADQAAIAALSKTSPFHPLPLGATGPVSVNFNFDYNVFGVNHIAAVKVINDKHLPQAELSNYIKGLQKKLNTACALEGWKEQTPVRCLLTLHKDGSVDGISLFFAGAGGKTLEETATKIIKKAEPFEPLPECFDTDLHLMLDFVGNKIVAREMMVSKNWELYIKLIDPPAIEKIVEPHKNIWPATLTPYLSQVLNKVTKAWNQPGTSKNESEQISFNIEKDGSISKLSLLKVTGDNAADKNILNAVIAAAPFAPLPASIATPLKIELESLSNEIQREKIQQKKAEDKGLLQIKRADPPPVENGILRLSASPLIVEKSENNGIARAEIDWRPFLNHIGWRLRQTLKLPSGAKCETMVAKFTVQSNGDITDLILQASPKTQSKDGSAQKANEPETDSNLERACLMAFKSAIKAASPLWNLPDRAPPSIKVECIFKFPMHRSFF